MSNADEHEDVVGQEAAANRCLWEADSIDTLRDYLDPATAGVTENTYFEVDEERALRLPEPRATASSRGGVGRKPEAKPRAAARRRNLRALGASERQAREWAGSGKGHGRVAGSWVLSQTLTDARWREQGLLGFSDPYRRLRDAERAARCGPACRVAWEGRG